MRRIIHFHRRPFPGNYSIETLFTTLRPALQAAGSPVVVETLPNFSKGLLPRLANIRWAKRRQGDVNHITGDVTYIALGLDPARTILTIHDCYALQRLTGIRRALLKRYWFDLPIKHCRWVTVVSKATEEELFKYVPGAIGKTVVIPNAISSSFQPCPKSFNSSEPRILHIGTAPNKNLSRLFQAIAGINCHLRIIGRLSADHIAELEKHRIRYSNAYDLSEQQIVGEYEQCDIVSFCSVKEGFGMPIVEGQWIERPVITSNLSSMPEIAGKGACLVNPLDPRSIREGLQRIIGSSGYREELIREGQWNRRRFSTEAVAAKYHELYKQTASAQ